MGSVFPVDICGSWLWAEKGRQMAGLGDSSGLDRSPSSLSPPHTALSPYTVTPSQAMAEAARAGGRTLAVLSCQGWQAHC